MKIKRLLLIISILFILIIGFMILYNDFRIKNAKVKVKIKNDLTVQVFSDVNVSDYIEKINGKLVSDGKIDTTKLGKKNITFYYKNNENILIPYTYTVDVVDKTPPLISKIKNLTLKQGYKGNIMDNFFCGDNYDDNVKCNIIGEYDLNKIGKYPVKFEAIDSSGNIEKYDLNINITDNKQEKNQSHTYFSDILAKYKTKNNKIGIDVSKWEGNIDFQKVKDAGVEFTYIRVGHQKGLNGEYIIDPNFKQNIEGFKNQGIKVGVYFFSHANTEDEAIKQANWVNKQIKNYKIDLEVVFDWENWEGFNNYGISFYNLTNIANKFMKQIEKKGYKAMLYSSKYYLENVWFKTKYDIWLAHYTNNTDYLGKYKVWQICDDGKIPGIEDEVDIDIMYN